MTEPVQVTHFVDAGCPWDYSAEPVRIALEQRYGEQLAWRNVQVGVAQSGETMAARGYTTAGLAKSYRVISERYGMPFCTPGRPRLVGTWAAARAVQAAERQAPELGDALLRRLPAWFLETRIVDERGELQRLARPDPRPRPSRVRGRPRQRLDRPRAGARHGRRAAPGSGRARA